MVLDERDTLPSGPDDAFQLTFIFRGPMLLFSIPSSSSYLRERRKGDNKARAGAWAWKK
jgi:hypothetical protein